MAKEEMTVEDAQKMIKDARAESLNKCQAEIDKVLNKHGCILVGIPQITSDGRIVASIAIRPKT